MGKLCKKNQIDPKKTKQANGIKDHETLNVHV